MAESAVKIKIKGDDKDFRKKMESIGEIAKNSFKVLGASAVAGSALAIKAIADLAEETREYRNDIATLVTSFEEAGFSGSTAKEVFKDFYSFLGEDDRSVEAANHLAKFCDNQKELTTWTNIAMGVWSQYQDSLPIEGLTEAANETIKTGKVTGVMADAINWAKTSTETWRDALSDNVAAQSAFNKALELGLTTEEAFNAALSACSDEQERQQIITAGLSAVYGDAATAYKETAASVLDANRAQAEQQELLAEIGERVEPVLTGMKIGWNEVLAAILELTENVDFKAFGEKIMNAFSGAAGSLGKFIEALQILLPIILTVSGIMGALKAGLFISGAVTAATKSITVITSAVAMYGNGAKIATIMTTGFSTAQKIMSTVVALATGKIKLAEVAQWAWNAAISANPVGLIIAAIVALIAAMVLLYNKSEKFRTFSDVKEIALDLWDSIQEILVAAGPLIDATWEFIKQVFAVALDFILWYFDKVWKGIKIIWDFVQPYFEALMEGIRIAAEILAEVLPQLFEGAWKAIKFIWDMAAPYFQQVWNTIKTIFSVVKAVLSGNFGDAWKAIKNWWNESKAYFTQIWENIKAVFANVVSFFEGKFKEAYNKVTGWWDNAISFFTEIWEGVKGVFKDVVSFFGDKFEEAYNKVKEWFTVDNFKSIFKDSICGGLENIIEDVKTAAGKVWTAIKDAMSKAISVVFGFGGGGDGGDDYGQGMTGSLSPFNVARISSNYGWRINPVTKKRQFHSGVDLAARGGTPIQSTTPGTVYRVAYEKNGFGNYVVIQDRNGNLHYYGHMSRTAARVGQPVLRGTRIGYVGTTGRSTGNHLHYGVKAGGNWTNPWAWLRGARGYATGGFPLSGELFFANENGIEMMGKMGKQNVVANNMQIIDGIRAGIYSGMLKLQQQNGSRTHNNNVSLTQNFYKENVSPSDTKRAARRGVREALAGGRA